MTVHPQISLLFSLVIFAALNQSCGLSVCPALVPCVCPLGVLGRITGQTHFELSALMTQAVDARWAPDTLASG